MRLILRQSFPLGRFHATFWKTNAFDKEVSGEWPPSPWRLIRAVVARWHQWRRETTDAAPEGELNRLVRALCKSEYRFYLPEQARQSFSLRQYHPVQPDRPPLGIRSYVTSLIQDNAWCVSPDKELLWFIEGDDWTDDLARVLDQCLQRIVYFGRAESLTSLSRIDHTSKSPNVNLLKERTSKNQVPVLAPDSEATPDEPRADIERVTEEEVAARNVPQGARLFYTERPQRPSACEPRCTPKRSHRQLIQFALGWAVRPEARATVRLTDRFRAAVLRNLIRSRTNNTAKKWSETPVEIREAIAEMTGKDSRGEPLRGPRRHAEFLLWWEGGVPTRLLVWRGSRPFDEEEENAILEAAAQELSWAAIGPEADLWKIKLVPLDTAVPPPPGFDGAPRSIWETLTPYVPPRHNLRRGKVRESETIGNQIRRELAARGYLSDTELLSVEEIAPPTWVAVHLPRRHAGQRSFHGGRRGYWLRIAFKNPLVGPIRLGHSSSFGLGLFSPSAT
ncbi:type I-U CRISPR-associated protein Csb2 [Methylacidimicrobium sp. B4]|uniref:type I-G CRISPR-associated protein Csb2 n=1 Tax=Methylacidimicrobium sp. B4 TaxID=2796139 RepID=UPI001A8C6B16|nr:type I-U CRISPR-associated protein Csb2 [Methylacidimicrobium sp. B4]QSR84162.1 type I-U CRISPR-associated protein Cas5/Cas6 [Methylacidimicrobium sp. B4]